MANKVIQYRYYGEGNTNNYPKDVSYTEFVNGQVFSNTLPILQLGIQTLPGTKFYLNGSLDPIIIGSTGIYELDLQNKTEITGFRFDPRIFYIINGKDNIKSTSGTYLIVDIVYDEMED
jgi:hypothetical protein